MGLHDAGIRKCVEQSIDEEQVLGALEHELIRGVALEQHLQGAAVVPVRLAHVQLRHEVVAPLGHAGLEVPVEHGKAHGEEGPALFESVRVDVVDVRHLGGHPVGRLEQPRGVAAPLDSISVPVGCHGARQGELPELQTPTT